MYDPPSGGGQAGRQATSKRKQQRRHQQSGIVEQGDSDQPAEQERVPAAAVFGDGSSRGMLLLIGPNIVGVATILPSSRKQTRNSCTLW